MLSSLGGKNMVTCCSMFVFHILQFNPTELQLHIQTDRVQLIYRAGPLF